MMTELRQRPLVLVVDDDEVGRMICCDALSESGFDVIEADDGGPALDLFQQRLPDIVLLDVVMNEMDGFEACEELRRMPGGVAVPVLMVTGLEDIASIQRAYDVGATDFISKPFNWTVLIHRLRYMLRADLSLRRLRIAEHDLSEAQRIAALGSFRWTLGDRQVTASREFLALLGLSVGRRHISGRRMLRMIHLQDISLLLDALRDAVKHADAFSVDCRLADERLGNRTLTIRGEVEAGTAGKAQVTGTVQDISERKRMELSLAAAKERAETGSAAKTAFLGVMSHELRTPMNAIIGFAEILQAELGSMKLPKLEEYAGLVVGNGRHLLNLINDILQMSKLEGKDVGLQLSPIDIPRLTVECLRVLKLKGSERGIVCDVQFAEDFPFLLADERYIGQVLLNLISNALKFTGDNGKVIISGAVDQNGSMVIRIIDKGIGMSDEECEIAVQPFHQAGTWLTRHHEGSGLGLSIAKRIVDIHGGIFHLRSKIGDGTTASLIFPKIQTVDNAQTPAPINEG